MLEDAEAGKIDIIANDTLRKEGNCLGRACAPEAAMKVYLELILTAAKLRYGVGCGVLVKCGGVGDGYLGFGCTRTYG